MLSETSPSKAVTPSGTTPSGTTPSAKRRARKETRVRELELTCEDLRCEVQRTKLDAEEQAKRAALAAASELKQVERMLKAQAEATGISDAGRRCTGRATGSTIGSQ